VNFAGEIDQKFNFWIVGVLGDLQRRETPNADSKQHSQ